MQWNMKNYVPIIDQGLPKLKNDEKIAGGPCHNPFRSVSQQQLEVFTTRMNELRNYFVLISIYDSSIYDAC